MFVLNSPLTMTSLTCMRSHNKLIHHLTHLFLLWLLLLSLLWSPFLSVLLCNLLRCCSFKKEIIMMKNEKKAITTTANIDIYILYKICHFVFLFMCLIRFLWFFYAFVVKISKRSYPVFPLQAVACCSEKLLFSDKNMLIRTIQPN